MNKRKILLVLIMILLLTGCNKHSNFTKYNDNLYEITYNDYNDNYFKNNKVEKKENKKKETNYTKESFGCSSFYTNGIDGRSFDYLQNDVRNASYVIIPRRFAHRKSGLSEQIIISLSRKITQYCFILANFTKLYQTCLFVCAILLSPSAQGGVD